MGFIINPSRFGGVPFSPDDITGLQLWLDATDIATLWTDDGVTQVATNGDAVYRWDDKSGNGYNVTRPASGNEPTYDTASYSVPCLGFDGTDRLVLSSGVTTDFNEMDIFIVIKLDVASALNDRILSFKSSASSNDAYDANGFPVYMFSATSVGVYYHSKDYYFQSLTDDESAFMLLRVDTDFNASGKSYIHIDGLERNSGTKGVTDKRPVSPDQIGIGGRSYANDRNMAGDICEVLVYDSVLADTDVGDLRVYLNSKYSELDIESPPLVAPSVSPGSVSGIVAWYDASVAASMYSDDGVTQAATNDAVYRWDDQSGNDRHIKNANATYQPALKNDGAYYVEFNQDKLEAIGSLTGESITEMTVLAVIDIDSTTAEQRRVLSISATSQADDTHADGSAVLEAYALSWRSQFNSVVSETVARVSSGFCIARIEVKFNTDRFTKVYEDGVFQSHSTQAGTYTLSPNDLAIGGRALDNTKALIGKVREIVAFDSVLSNSDAAGIERYLNDKWSVV